MDFVADATGVPAVGKGFPAQSKCTFVDEESGVKTKIMCSSYSDRHFVIISQKEKFGTMVELIITGASYDV
jgi:hypothetical protein